MGSLAGRTRIRGRRFAAVFGALWWIACGAIAAPPAAGAEPVREAGVEGLAVPGIERPAEKRAAPSANPNPNSIESAALAARFPDPDVRYRTPAFEPGHDGFTSNAELRALLQGLVSDDTGGPGATRVRLKWLGSSQAGVPLEALHFTRSTAAEQLPAVNTARPTVLLIGQQHGDEPAGAEALIVIAQELAHGRLQPLLERIDVLIVVRANPDGAALGQRLTASASRPAAST